MVMWSFWMWIVTVYSNLHVFESHLGPESLPRPCLLNIFQFLSECRGVVLAGDSFSRAPPESSSEADSNGQTVEDSRNHPGTEGEMESVRGRGETQFQVSTRGRVRSTGDLAVVRRELRVTWKEMNPVFLLSRSHNEAKWMSPGLALKQILLLNNTPSIPIYFLPYLSMHWCFQ